jgi:serine/threonine protein kinase
LKVSDFGLSALCTPKTLLKNACGSPLYSAPEILRREPYDGRAADVWAMGVVLFAMVTGEIAWHGATLKDQIPFILKGQYYPPPYLSTECKNLINSMLTVSPSKRATISQIRNHPWLQKCSSMVDITMRSPEFTERMNKLMAQKRHPIAPNAEKRNQVVQTTNEAQYNPPQNHPRKR